MAYKLITALNVGLIIAILVVLLRQPGGVPLAAVFVLVLALCLGLWMFFRGRRG